VQDARKRFDGLKARHAADSASGKFWGGKPMLTYGRVEKKHVAPIAEPAAPPLARAKKRRGAADSSADPLSLDVGQLEGATLSLFYDHHGWCEGVVKSAVGLDCKVVFPERDGDSRTFEEDVTLPDDTIRVVRWGDGSPATGAWAISPAAAAVSSAAVASASSRKPGGRSVGKSRAAATSVRSSSG
jgi:hypothetical protein